MKLPDSYILEPVKECRPDEMRLLLQSGDWWEEYWDDSVLCSIVEHSFAFIVAKDPDDRWIGMGRIISDGVSDAYLQDIVVLPQWREKGIGTAIVKKLMALCADAGIGWIGIIAGPETEYFYRRFGFGRMGGYTPMRFESAGQMR
jgi:aralkylamine N-acetyltransferase